MKVMNIKNETGARHWDAGRNDNFAGNTFCS